MIQNTKLAKFVYFLSGELTRIKTYRQTWTWENPEVFMEAEAGEALPELDMRKAGRIWMPCRLSMTLLVLSNNLDVKHWDHWALEHMNCEDGQICNDCGGHVDPPFEDD